MAKELTKTAQRLRERMDETGWTQESLADAVGVTQGTISQIITGKSHKSRHLPAIANTLAINLNWLMGITDQKIEMFDTDGQQISEDTLAAMRAGVIENRLQDPSQLTESRSEDVESWASDHGLVAVRQIDLAFGMGATYLDQPVSEVAHFFPEEWLREFTSSPASMLFFAKGVGDSMLPTLSPNDTMIIDCSEKRLTMSDQIWAVTYCGLGMVKRLRPTKDGGIRILSDNPLVPEEVAYDGELNLIGRVVAVMRKV